MERTQEILQENVETVPGGRPSR